MTQPAPSADDVSGGEPARPVVRMNVAVLRVAPDGRLLEVNDTACRWLGYTRGELLRLSVFDINPQIEAAAWDQCWARLREHTCLVHDSVHRRRDGTTYPVELTSTYLVADDAEFAITVAQDTSERLRTRQQLEALAARLNEAQQIAGIGNWERDLTTQRVTWSAQMYRLLGHEPGAFELRPGSVRDRVHPDDRHDLRRAIDRAIAEAGAFEASFRIRRADGVYRMMHSRGRVITDAQGRAVLLNGTMQDITDLAEVHRELKAAVDRLNAAQRVAHVGSWDHDLPSDMEFWSEELYRIFGYEPGTVRTTHDFFLSRVHPDDRQAVIDGVRVAVERGDDYSYEFRIVLPDGRVRDCISRGRVERDELGTAVRMYGTCQDLTDRKQAESALRRSEKHYRRAAEANRRLLAEVNHRVRNNLTGLLSLLRITREETRSVEEFSDLMRQRITAMAKAHNLLAGTQWHALDLHTLIRAIAAGYCHTDHHEQRVRLDGPTTWISPRQVVPLALALNELFINAAKHGCYATPDGRLEVAWRHDERQITVDWRETGGPPIVGPVKPSLGTELINGFICFELNGRIEMTYPADGARHALCVPLERADLSGTSFVS